MGSSRGSSPLSNIESDSYEHDHFNPHAVESTMPPAKRQRLDEHSVRDSPASHLTDDEAPLSSISSDTSGDVPQSPGASGRIDDEDAHQEQVTVCEWLYPADGKRCPAGDLGDMDNLVAHIHTVHIEGRGKKYTCEWDHCSRKSQPHASAYALKAHMRSHTREKPFYCALPECDRSFTRSDALAKHMRTVHETEALRPSDPIPKSMQPQLGKGNNRIKIVIKNNGHRTNGDSRSPSHGRSTDPSANSAHHEGLTPLTTEQGFLPEELALDSKELWRLLRRQVHWAEEEQDSLKQELDMMNELRNKEWLEKEILLDQVIKNEMDWMERRNHVLATLPTVEELRAQTMTKLQNLDSKDGDEDRNDEQDAAAEVLANMAQAV